MMLKNPITISVNLTDDDLVDFYEHNARRGILMKMVIAFALLVFAAQVIHILADPMALYDGAWQWLLAVVALFLMMYYSNRYNAKKAYKMNPRLRESHYYIISEDNIHIKGGSFDTVFQWDKLYGMTESRKCFFIWLSKDSAQIIPKRDMLAGEIVEVSELRKRKFKKK